MSQDGMTVLHLAAKFGHVDVLEVLRGKVPWSMASVKVKNSLKGTSAFNVACWRLKEFICSNSPEKVSQKLS